MASGAQDAAVWIPLLSALAGGIIASVASLGGIWVAGRQRRTEQAQERRTAQARELDAQCSSAVSESAALVMEALAFFEAPSEDRLEGARKAASRAINALVLLAINHPSEEILALTDELSDLAGLVFRDCFAVQAGQMTGGEAQYSETSSTLQMGGKMNTLIIRLREFKQSSPGSTRSDEG